MTIPDYETIMLPVLKLAGDGNEHSLRDVTDHIINEFDLTEDEQKDTFTKRNSKSNS